MLLPTSPTAPSTARRSPSTRPSGTPRPTGWCSPGSTSRTAPASRSTTRAPTNSRRSSRSGSTAATPPDLAFIPQPGLLAAGRDAGKLKPRRRRQVATWWTRTGPPTGSLQHRQRHVLRRSAAANVKSLRLVLAEDLQGQGLDGPDHLGRADRPHARPSRTSGTKPWCAGIESGDATGWPATDWIEDVLLRQAGPSVYDQWITHEHPVQRPEGRRRARHRAATSSRTRSTSTAASATSRASPPPPSRRRACRSSPASAPCTARRPSSRQLAGGHQGGRGRRRLRVLLPGHRRRPRASRSAAASSSRPSPTAPRSRRCRPTWPPASTPTAASRSATGVSDNKGLDLANGRPPTWTSSSIDLLQDPKTAFRFDGSDLMPAAVGAGTFWKGMVDWINGKPTTGSGRQRSKAAGRIWTDSPARSPAGPPCDRCPDGRVDGASLRCPRSEGRHADGRRFARKLVQVVIALAVLPRSIAVIMLFGGPGPRRSATRRRSSASSCSRRRAVGHRTGLCRPSRPSYLAFMDRNGATNGVGQLRSGCSPSRGDGPLRNTLLWVVLVPLVATGIGLVYAVLIDRARGEKALPSR